MQISHQPVMWQRPDGNLPDVQSYVLLTFLLSLWKSLHFHWISGLQTLSLLLNCVLKPIHSELHILHHDSVLVYFYLT